MNKEPQSFTFIAPNGETLTTEAGSYQEALDWLMSEVGDEKAETYIYRGE